MNGALVISLDFEGAWGVRPIAPGAPILDNLRGEREGIRRTLELFRRHDVAATWATVGFLFARSREDLAKFSPARRPRYANRRLFPYDETVGHGPKDDPFHFAPDVIEQIQATPRQDVETHTFSHYYCLEHGQDFADFDADIEAATVMAKRDGVTLKSIVFPRNQRNPAYDEVLLRHGIRCYRGNQRNWIWKARRHGEHGYLARAGMLVDTYVEAFGSLTIPWHQLRQSSGLVDVPASAFVGAYQQKRAALEPLRRARVLRMLRHAARKGEIAHLWWHPYNFGRHTEANLAFLTAILEEHVRLRHRHGMESLTMAEVAQRVSEERAAA